MSASRPPGHPVTPDQVAKIVAGIPGAPTRWQRLRMFLVAVAVFGVFTYAAAATSFTPWRVISGAPEIGDLFLRMMPTEKVSEAAKTGFQGCWPVPSAAAIAQTDRRAYVFCWHKLVSQVRFVPETWGPLAETLRIAVISTTVGALLAIPFTLLSVRNLMRFPAVYWTVRTFLNLVRTIPDLVLAAIFVGAFGVGALPGILAMSVISFTIIAKLLSESVEAIDPGPVEAIRATGANRLQVIGFAVVPQVLPQFVAYSLYVFEINVRASAILGLVGAGGIGMTLKTYWSYFSYQEPAVIILVILAVVVVTDFVSTRIRERLV